MKYEVQSWFRLSDFKKRTLALFLILLLAGFFRFYQLNQVPPSPSLDEVSIGYNAYSILKTGRDEYGTKFPVLLRAYDDWRPALYVYLVIPFVKFFGLSVAAVRLPAVLLSMVTILATYFLVKELFFNISPPGSPFGLRLDEVGLRPDAVGHLGGGEAATSTPARWLLPLATTFLLSISPWHIYISRLGHEVNLGLTLSILAIFLFLKYRKDTSEVAAGRKSNPNFKFRLEKYERIRNKWESKRQPRRPPRRWRTIGLILAALFFALSLYTYQSLKIFTPLMVGALILLYRKQVVKNFKHFLVAGLLGLVVLIPILKTSFTAEGMARFQATSLLSHSPEIFQQSALRIARDYEQKNYLGLIFDNRRVETGLTILRAYFSHFDPRWLFFNQGQEKHKVPGLGVFYLWELPLLLIGSYQLVKGKFPQQSKLLIFSWLLISPLPASISTETPHAMRTFNILPMPQILGAIGLVAIGKKLTEDTSEARRVGGRGGRLNVSEAMTPLRWTWKEKGKFIMTLVVFLLLSSLAFLFHNYFTNFPHEQSESFQYALAQSMNEVLKIEDDYEKIIFSNQDHCYQSYMFWLFFAKFDPEVYLAEGGTVSGGFAETHAFEKYEFRPINWEKEKKRPRTLYVGNLDDFPIGVAPLETFRYLDGKQAIGIVEP